MKITNRHDWITIASTATLFLYAITLAWLDHSVISCVLLLWPLMIWGFDRGSI